MQRELTELRAAEALFLSMQTARKGGEDRASTWEANLELRLWDVRPSLRPHLPETQQHEGPTGRRARGKTQEEPGNGGPTQSLVLLRAWSFKVVTGMLAQNGSANSRRSMNQQQRR